ncbi:MAG: carbon-nitrogen family hydrolase [Cyanobacteria bacterium NC_groundwater_1444_Ag_S-0.65um_54_12]|nr:carbon-nitrogen family hydrolase [Cyanobacteria bacterium NC_groundwater_1444_Ag_S-0.65um_54_12]
MSFTVSVAQIPLQEGNPEANLATAKQAVCLAAQRGSDLLLLPELWLSGYDLENAGALALAPGDPFWEIMGELAQTANIAIAGSVLSRSVAGVQNLLVIFSSKGKCLASYAKVHLFGPMKEDRYLVAGNGLAIADLGWCRAGLAICYDLRFPELFRLLASSGAAIILLPAQWPHPRLMPWRTLVRARAIENQVFLLAANRVGKAGDLTYCGHSMIVDPTGDILQEAGEHPTLLTVEIDLAQIIETRERMPVWGDRRPDIYQRWLTPKFHD